MGPFAAGQIVLLKFPYSDLSGSKLRPVLLLADTGSSDWITCQITSNPYRDVYALRLDQSHFKSGSLQRVSYVRPNKFFTADESLILSVPGAVLDEYLERVRDSAVAAIREVLP
jgi:mRNA interferase MazF